MRRPMPIVGLMDCLHHETQFRPPPARRSDTTTNSACAAGPLVDAFFDAAHARWDHPAIVTADGSWTYGQVVDASRRVACFLLAQPCFQAGSRVLLLLDNGPEYLAAFCGTLLAGGVAVPLPPTEAAERVDYLRRMCDADIALTRSRIAARRRDFDSCRRETIDAVRDHPPMAATPCSDADRLALLLFTSGSCGAPKGVMLSHANLLANARSILRYLPVKPDDRTLALLPFYHAYGNSVMQTHLLAGATLVVDGSAVFPMDVLDTLRRQRITSFSGVPELYYSLLVCPELKAAALPDVRYMTVAGGALESEAVLEMAWRIDPAKFYVMYGQTEATARLAYLPPKLVPRHPGSIGRAIPWVTLKVLDDFGQPVGPGETGELCAKGPNIMMGYWKAPELTARTLRDGWLRTGDLAAEDAHGLFYIKGRKNGLVKVQGRRLHPLEVEQAISGCMPAARYVVVPFQRARTTRLALYAVPQDDNPLTAELIRGVCRRILPAHKVPAYIEVLYEMPLNASLKVDCQALSRRAEMRSEDYAKSLAADDQTTHAR